MKPMLVFILFKDSVHPSNRTPLFTVAKIRWLMVCKEIITAFNKNHTDPINTKFIFADD